MSEKCLKCGSEKTRIVPRTTICLDCKAEFDTDKADEVERLEGIVDALPRTADGVPVVPGMKLWTYRQTERWPTLITADHLHMSGAFTSGRGKARRTSLCYSTRKAAEAARKANG